MITPTFFELLNEERQRQDNKWGVQNHYDTRWLSILTEELGEVAKDINEFSREERLIEELVQVGAVCQAWYESILRRGANPILRPHKGL